MPNTWMASKSVDSTIYQLMRNSNFQAYTPVPTQVCMSQVMHYVPTTLD
jgi:hypothetical protein